MTIAINPTTVSASIAALSISGVTIKDVDEIPDTVNNLCPVLMPQPNNFVTDIQVVRQSFGSNGTQKLDCNYTLNYLFLYAEVGSGIGAFAPYSGLLTLLTTTLNVILNNDSVTGLVDMSLAGVSNVGVVTDPSDREYWGVQIALRCLEYAQ